MRPIWHDILDALRDEIVVGSVRDISDHFYSTDTETYEISPSTIRKYLNLMESRGVVRSVPSTSYADSGRSTNVRMYSVVETERTTS